MFKNSIALGKTTQNIGKPGTQTKINRTVPPPPDNSSTAGNKQKYKNKSYYLSSPGVSGIKANEGSKGYPDVDNPSKVKAIASTELSIENTQNGTTVTIDIHWRDGIEVGDRVLFRGVLWVIFGISDNREITQGCLSSTSLQLTMGKLVVSSLAMENRDECNALGDTY